MIHKDKEKNIFRPNRYLSSTIYYLSIYRMVELTLL